MPAVGRPWPSDDDDDGVSGKIEVAAVRGEKIPTGWAVNGEGRNTNDPR